MGAIASQITSLTIVYSTVYSDADKKKHQSSASLAFVRGIHRGPVNSPHKWPVTRKMFPFDDVIMLWDVLYDSAGVSFSIKRKIHLKILSAILPPFCPNLDVWIYHVTLVAYTNKCIHYIIDQILYTDCYSWHSQDRNTKLHRFNMTERRISQVEAIYRFKLYLFVHTTGGPFPNMV